MGREPWNRSRTSAPPTGTRPQDAATLKRWLRLSPEATADLQAIRAWYRQPGAGAAAAAKIKALVAGLNNLVQTPCAHRRSNPPGRREMVLQGHRVLYRVLPDTGSNDTAGDVEIIRIFGPGQNF